jgi:hypothetical protein
MCHNPENHILDVTLFISVFFDNMHCHSRIGYMLRGLKDVSSLRMAGNNSRNICEKQ